MGKITILRKRMEKNTILSKFQENFWIPIFLNFIFLEDTLNLGYPNVKCLNTDLINATIS